MVLVSFQPFVDSVFDSFRNDGEIAVFQVEEQFFERTSDLDPRMIPAHDAVNALFVGNVFDDVAGMFQWKIHLIALHREDAAVTFGQGMNRAGEMGGICRCSQVINHVAGRLDTSDRGRRRCNDKNGG